MKTKIQIKSIWGNLLFEYEKKDNSIKDTLLKAVQLKANLTGADLTGAYLTGADLTRADLTRADLTGADLTGADLTRADLTGAYLMGADLTGAYLMGADLTGANLMGADLTGAYLMGADLTGAYLTRADLTRADLTGAQTDNIESLKEWFWIIPEQGAFEAWKKLADNRIAKILIPAKAKRTCNLKNRKCRAEYVKTIAIWDKEGNRINEGINGTHNKKVEYTVGKITRADMFDDSILEDCSHGIHFFVTRQEAQDW